MIDIAGACQTKMCRGYVECTYPKELKIKDVTETAISASYHDLHLKIDREWWLSVNFTTKETITISPFLVICSKIANALKCGVCISQLIRFNSFTDIPERWLLLIRKLLNQGFEIVTHYNRYGITV